MKLSPFLFVAGSLMSITFTASATTRYVNLNNPAPAAPYASWATAATNIQTAVDAAAPGEHIVVTNGVYQTGTRLASGLSCRVAVTKAVTVRSANGPAVTIILGLGPVGDTAVRCAYVTNGAVLAGFTLTNGASQSSGAGGGVYCASASSLVSNCVLTGNAAYEGGGVFSGTLVNCTLKGNSSSSYGGGASSATLIKCTLSGNSANSYGVGGGASYCLLSNCTLTGNYASVSGGGAANSTLNFCTLSGNGADGYGGGGFTATLNNCALIGNWAGNQGGGAAEYSVLNNCLLTGNSATYGGATAYSYPTNCTVVGNSASTWGGGTFYGTRANCIMYYNTAPTGPNYYQGTSAYCCATPAPSGTGNFATVPLFAYTNGWANLRLQTGSPCLNTGNNASAPGAMDLDGNPRISRGTVDIGAYEAQAVHYVALASSNPQAPFNSWATAATNIQAAVDAAVAADEIVVSNGVYQTGVRAVYGVNHRVAFTKPLTVRSVNGPAVTTIVGAGPTGASAVRCVYLTNNTLLAGFTLTNGATPSTGNSYTNQSGGGVWCEPSGVILSNCVLAGNSAAYAGGGSCAGTLKSCILTGNTAPYGGAAYSGSFSNCTLAGNSAYSGGGVYSGALYNSIVYYNSAMADPNYFGGTLQYCCTLPLPALGTGNFTSEPRFSDTNGWANLRLSSDSPCINTGNNAYAPSATDLDGKPRIRAGTVDLGPYEFQPVRYVALASSNPQPPYHSWATAATNIQDAIDASLPNDEIVVSNGVYRSGARFLYNVSNRVAITKAVTVRSLNGPALTTIVGSGPSGPAAVRCVYLTNGATLSGFTLTNGATQATFDILSCAGGGVWCESTNAIVSNCVIAANSARYAGGAYAGTLNNCALVGNWVSDSGGAAYGSVLNNCLLARNSAVSYNGGGALSCTLKNCTLAGNSAYFYGGGAYTSALTNCIVYYNTAYSGPNYESSSLAYCCAMPLAPGPGNFTNEPCFASADGCGNLRLQPGSPCRDAGNNALALGLTDLDGNPRITSGKVDLGAYEFPCADSFQAWLAQYGLPTDGSADCTDPDHDGCNNWQEWVAGTDPCSTESALRILSVTTGPSGRTVTWSSANYRFYSLQAATNLAAVPDFHDVQPNIQGWPGTTSWTDPTAVGSAPKFYRVRVEN